MIVVVCIDDKNGMTFNHRRQSRDRLLIEDLLRFTGEKIIYTNTYSSSLFAEYPERYTEDKDYLDKAEENDICFVETDDLKDYAEKISGIILYRWNRHYPSTTKLMLNLSEYHLQERTEFAGSSHEKITREVYSK